MIFTKKIDYCKMKFMGKCKKRTLQNKNSTYFMTRQDAVNKILDMYENKSPNHIEAIDTISLFGISAEELSEAGLSYENLKALDFHIN